MKGNTRCSVCLPIAFGPKAEMIQCIYSTKFCYISGEYWWLIHHSKNNKKKMFLIHSEWTSKCTRWQQRARWFTIFLCALSVCANTLNTVPISMWAFLLSFFAYIFNLDFAISITIIVIITVMNGRKAENTYDLDTHTPIFMFIAWSKKTTKRNEMFRRKKSLSKAK